MRNTVNKIIICGGGSAGWMAASVLSQQFPEKEIALIESPDFPVIGVGESTLGTINSFLSLLGLEEKDWMPEAQATYKLGIKFSDFYKKDDAYYYPFGVKDMQNTSAGVMDWYVKKAYNKEIHPNDFYESFYSCMPFIYDNKIYDNQDGQLPGFSWDNDVAYHMDAIAFGQTLRKKVAEPNGVVHIEATITEVFKDHEGYVSGLKLDNGDVLEADLYLDCSGFKSMLLGEALETPYESFRDWLPNQMAWTCHVPYTDKEVEMENVTNCTAYNNGWVWNIPLYNRIGSGYVFDPVLSNKDEALEDYKAYLNSNRMKLPKENRTDEIENFKLIDIKNGMHEVAWKNNVVAVGLSFGFIEPLESTGLLTVQESLLRICETLHLETINRIHVDSYNYVMRSIMHSFRDFVTYHYTLSSRRDTEYWRQMTEWKIMDATMTDQRLQDLNSTPKELANRMLQSHDLPGDMSMGGMPDIFVGNRYTPANVTQLKVLDDLVTWRQGQPPELFTKQTQDYWDQKKDYINTLAEDAPSHYQYLTDNIYNDNEDS